MILTIVIAIYIISMLAALVFMIMWLRGSIKKQPNNKWKHMIVAMVVITVSGTVVSAIRSEQYQAEQRRIERVARHKAKILKRDLKRLDVTNLAYYDGTPVLLMQPNARKGEQPNLTGTAAQQAEVFENAQKAMRRLHKNASLRANGVIVVSYVKVHKKFKPLFVLYVSKHAVKHLSKKPVATNKFLTEELSGYWFNHKLLADKDDKLPSFLDGIPTRDTKHFTKDLKKRVIKGKDVFKNPKKKPTKRQETVDDLKLTDTKASDASSSK